MHDLGTLCDRPHDAPAGDEVDAAGSTLLDRWDERHRAYHGRQHLQEVLAALDVLVSGEGMDRLDAAIARAAAWFHDAVYDPTDPATNELRSADLATAQLGRLGVCPRIVAAVDTLVRASADHTGMAAAAAGRAFHDADLWILSAPVGRFDEYCLQIRAEYSHVPEADYRAARRGILTRLTETGQCYLTGSAGDWEEPARRNLSRELHRLSC